MGLKRRLIWIGCILWILAPSVPVGALAEPTLNALSAVVMEASTGRILYEKNAYEERPMASTTKIMTLLVALEADCAEELAVVSELAARQPEVHMDMRAGEAYRMRDLYYAMMLESWNDTAVVIAEHISGSVEAFCERMTERAAYAVQDAQRAGRRRALYDGCRYGPDYGVCYAESGVPADYGGSQLHDP